jgi:hypothetical protein
MRPLSLSLLVAAAACGGTAPVPAEVEAPRAEDPAFQLSAVPAWSLIGNALTPGNDRLSLEVVAPASVGEIHAYFDDGRPPIALHREGRTFSLAADVGDLAPGEHRIILAADRADVGFAAPSFVRSHPLYVVVSVDWDRSDTDDAALARHVTLHQAHDELKITHFIGPYLFTSPGMSDDRRAQLVAWAAAMRDDWGDELGVHIHPFCHFVDPTSVPCRTEPSSVYTTGDETGYSVLVASYTEQEFTTLLEESSRLFAAAGLGAPTSFRAGGWTAELHTLRALVNAGYRVDSSANNWTRMEEWSQREGAILYEWNMRTWATIGDTSQPYYPSATDMLSTEAPRLPLLEVPDNGILVDYVTADEMTEIFDANFDPAGLAVPTVYQIGFHANNFSAPYYDRMNAALAHADQYRASAGAGPVVYVNISELVTVFPPPG